MKQSGLRPPIVAVIILVILFATEVSSAVVESPIIDEGVHLAAGLSYWRTGDFRMNPEHPPLIKLLSTLPLLLTPMTIPTDHPTWITWDEWEFADYLLTHSPVSIETMLLLARLPIMLLSIGLGWLIYRASRELFGQWGGVFSLTLYAFDPNIIAHSRYVTTDLGFTAFTFLSIYCLARLLQQPTVRRAMVFSLALVAAGVSKFSGIALTASIAVSLGLIKVLRPSLPALRGRVVGRWLFIWIPLAALLVWAIYGFDVRRPAEDPRINQLYSQREELLKTTDPSTLPPLERFAVEQLGDRARSIGAWLERASQHSIPGYAFWRGFFAVLGHSIGGQESYLLGSYADRGWWYYFPVALMVKTPLPTVVGLMAILVLASAAVYRRRRTGQAWRSIIAATDIRIVLYASLPIVFLLLSLGSKLNLGWRHIMPIYPFLFVLLGWLNRLPRPRVTVRWLVPGLLATNLLLIQVATYPNELGYFSELIGGARSGPRYLLDSNLDWGQDLPKLAAYVRQRGISRLPFAYYGRANLAHYVPAATTLPSTDDVIRQGRPQGTVAISVGELFRRDRRYRWLWSQHPNEVIGSSIFVYH